MFESTLEAQGLHRGEKKLGMVSAAPLVHGVIVVFAEAVTAVIVPPIRTPLEPRPILVTTPGIPLDDLASSTPTRAPKKGSSASRPGTSIAPPTRVPPPVPPKDTPVSLPAPGRPLATGGPDGLSEGGGGDPNGNPFGIDGGTGDADASVGNAGREDGAVDSAEVSASRNPLFDEAALDAVRRWRYRPALLNGRPVRVYVTVVVDFVVR